MNRTCQTGLLGIGFLFLVGVAGPQQIYKRTDERGVVHFGEQPPPHAKGEATGPRSDLAQRRLSDAEIKKILVGRWEAVETTVRGVEDYRDGGVLIATGAMETSTGTRTFTLAGRWYVENGYIVAILERSSIPDVLRPGLVTRDYVLSIDERVLRYRSESGKISVRHRLSEGDRR